MRFLIWLFALLPVAYAAVRFSVQWHPVWLSDIFAFAERYLHVTLTKAPADPLKFLSDLSGNSALWLLAASLAVSPLKSYLKINLIKYRRLVGLGAFSYAAVHVLLFFGVDQQFSVPGVMHEVVNKPFIAFGMGAFAILSLMALTSGKGLYGKFKGWHKLVYIAVVLISIHYLMSHKTVTLTHASVVGTLCMLLALRLLKR